MLVPSTATVLVTVNEAKNVPTSMIPGRVISRFIRVGIFSQRQVISNVFTIPCDETDTPESPSWTIRQSSFNLLTIPKDGIIARAGAAALNPCLLFELCVVVQPFNLNSLNAKQRVSQSKGMEVEREYSCAWGLLPMIGPDGKSIDAKSYDVKLYGGSPERTDFLPLEKEKFKHGKFDDA